MSKDNFLKRAFQDMKDNAKAQKKIDKENIEAIKQDNKEMRDALKNYKSQDIKEFKEADGLVEKAKVVLSHMERDGKQMAEENRENYKKMLEEQRQNMKNNMNN